MDFLPKVPTNLMLKSASTMPELPGRLKPVHNRTKTIERLREPGSPGGGGRPPTVHLPEELFGNLQESVAPSKMKGRSRGRVEVI